MLFRDLRIPVQEPPETRQQPARILRSLYRWSRLVPMHATLSASCRATRIKNRIPRSRFHNELCEPSSKYQWYLAPPPCGIPPDTARHPTPPPRGIPPRHRAASRCLRLRIPTFPPTLFNTPFVRSWCRFPFTVALARFPMQDRCMEPTRRRWCPQPARITSSSARSCCSRSVRHRARLTNSRNFVPYPRDYATSYCGRSIEEFLIDLWQPLSVWPSGGNRPGSPGHRVRLLLG